MSGDITFVQASNAALSKALSEDPAVFLLGEDIADPQGGGVSKVTAGLSTKFGEDRVRTTPISEQAIMGAAIGAALAGMRPVAEIMLMNFLTVCQDQLFNHAAKLRFMSGGQTSVPLTVRCSTGGGYGFGAQHSDMLETWIAHSAGLKVVLPSSPADMQGLLLSCIFDDDPCVIIEHTGFYFTGAKGPALEPGIVVPLGKASTLRAGADLTVVGYGVPIRKALAVADRLAAEADIEVIDLRTVSPWDEQAVLASVARTKRAVVVHESVKRFGVGAEISSRIHEELFSELAVHVQRVGAGFSPVPYSPPLEQAFLPQEDTIEAAIRAALR